MLIKEFFAMTKCFQTLVSNPSIHVSHTGVWVTLFFIAQTLIEAYCGLHVESSSAVCAPGFQTSQSIGQIPSSCPHWCLGDTLHFCYNLWTLIKAHCGVLKCSVPGFQTLQSIGQPSRSHSVIFQENLTLLVSKRIPK